MEELEEELEFKWYVVRTFSGHEKKVKSIIDLELEENDALKARIAQVLVPEEKIFQVKDGKKRIKIRNFFPGYILVEADLDNRVIDFITNTSSVMNFLGDGGKPNPLQASEVKRIIGRISTDEEGAEVERTDAIFRTGDYVKIIDGPFSNFSGVVEEVNEDKLKMKVLVSIFSRKTPVEIDFVQAELEK